MTKVIKLHKWVRAKLDREEHATILAKLFNHYHRLRLYEAEVLSKKVHCRECPHRH